VAEGWGSRGRGRGRGRGWGKQGSEGQVPAATQQGRHCGGSCPREALLGGCSPEDGPEGRAGEGAGEREGAAGERRGESGGRTPGGAVGVPGRGRIISRDDILVGSSPQPLEAEEGEEGEGGGVWMAWGKGGYFRSTVFCKSSIWARGVVRKHWAEGRGRKREEGPRVPASEVNLRVGRPGRGSHVSVVDLERRGKMPSTWRVWRQEAACAAGSPSGCPSTLTPTPTQTLTHTPTHTPLEQSHSPAGPPTPTLPEGPGAPWGVTLARPRADCKGTLS